MSLVKTFHTFAFLCSYWTCRCSLFTVFITKKNNYFIHLTHKRKKKNTRKLHASKVKHLFLLLLHDVF